MLLKRQQKDKTIKAMYNSSNILASIYNEETNDLTLIFNKGSQYKYPKVNPSDYNRFELAESQGKVFNTHIKAYSFEKLTDIDPKEIITEIENLRIAEKVALIKGKQDKLVHSMKLLIAINDSPNGTNQFTELDLTKLQNAITEYLAELKK